MKFTFTSEDVYDTSKVTHEFKAVHIDDIIHRFEDFLRGCGFVLDGSLEIVSENEKLDFPTDSINWDDQYRIVTMANDVCGSSFAPPETTGARGDDSE